MRREGGWKTGMVTSEVSVHDDGWKERRGRRESGKQGERQGKEGGEREEGGREEEERKE